MGFWTTTGADSKDPKRNFRFKVEFGGIQDQNDSIIWWAKKVGKPNFTVTEAKHAYLNHTFYWPGRVEWQTINMTLVDPVSPNATSNILKLIEAAGYTIPGSSSDLGSFSKKKFADEIATLIITQIDSGGAKVEQWTLHNPFIKSAKFGELDYENDDLTTIELEIRYDWGEYEGDVATDKYFSTQG